MNLKISELMTTSVITTRPQMTVDRVRQLMAKNRIGAIPVVNDENEPVGIVSARDLVANGISGNTPIRSIMTEPVYTVPQYNDISAAARLMRNRKIHHVVVTHEKQVVGMLSAYDLLRLVEDHQFALKNPPPVKKHRRSQRR